MDTVAYLLLWLMALGALALLWAEGLLRRGRCAAIAVAAVAAAFLLRSLCMPHQTLDYVNFLSQWVQYFRDNGGFAALRESIGNYNVPYLYFLAAFSYSDIPDLYLIKLLSVFFEIVLAWGVMRLVGHFTRRVEKRLGAFLAVLFLPTVLLNGAYWGQCDAIYVALGVLAICLALERRPILSVLMLTLSFSFKLQAIFLIPVFLVFWYCGYFRFWHFLLFPLFYLGIVTPALVAGRPLLETLTLYIDQSGSVGSAMNYNSPSVFALITWTGNNTLLSQLGIGAAFAFMLCIWFWLWMERRHVTEALLVECALLLAVGIPFFLPHMHDRYFFAADILSLALAFLRPKLFPVPIAVSFASLLGYHAYLRGYYLLPMSWGALALIFVLVLLILDMAGQLRQEKRREIQI